MTSTTDKRRHEAVEQASGSFWAMIVKHYPEADTGDLSPESTRLLDAAMDAAVAEWVENNVRPFVNPRLLVVGTRVRFVREVDRYPFATAKAGELGTVSHVEYEKDGDRIANVAVTLDRFDPGLREWHNAVEWYGVTGEDDANTDYPNDVEPI
jgi:hypothetical protein